MKINQPAAPGRSLVQIRPRGFLFFLIYIDKNAKKKIIKIKNKKIIYFDLDLEGGAGNDTSPARRPAPIRTITIVHPLVSPIKLTPMSLRKNRIPNNSTTKPVSLYAVFVSKIITSFYKTIILKVVYKSFDYCPQENNSRVTAYRAVSMNITSNFQTTSGIVNNFESRKNWNRFILD